MKKVRASFIIFSLMITAGYSQDFGNLIKGAEQDANYLVEGYVSPVLKSLGYGLNQGWYNTAKPHKTLGIDVTATLSLVTVPTSAQTFTIEDSKLSALKLISPSDHVVPTILGPSNIEPVYEFKDPAITDQIVAPAGAGLAEQLPIVAIPVPIANVGIGIIKGTELKIRYLPKLNFNKAQIDMIGFAVMHDIKQHIPVVKNLPFDLSVLAGFTTFNASTEFDLGQSGILKAKATTVQAIVSKKLSILTLYAAAGYAKSNVSFDAKGTYDVGGGASLTDPVSISAANSGARLTGGFRLKLAILTLHADYTLQKYPTISTGVGLSVR
jgi:hypothetical protein